MNEPTTESPSTADSGASTSPAIPSVGRNEPCPCGSGKKYKRCHGAHATPQLSPQPAQTGNAEAYAAAAQKMGMPGMDPSQMDPEFMDNVMKAMRRLPRAQLVQFQRIFQRSMAGEDVSREAALLEKTLPPQFRALMNMMTSGMGQAMAQQAAQKGPAGGAAPELSEDEARKIVEEAIRTGKVSKEEGEKLLAAQAQAQGAGSEAAAGSPKKSGGFWKKIVGKTPTQE